MFRSSMHSAAIATAVAALALGLFAASAVGWYDKPDKPDGDHPDGDHSDDHHSHDTTPTLTTPPVTPASGSGGSCSHPLSSPWLRPQPPHPRWQWLPLPRQPRSQR